jgi:glycerol uptake facilitator-like aquaporin
VRVPYALNLLVYESYPIHTPAAFLGEAFGTAVLAFVIFSLTHPGNDTMKNNVYIPPFIGLCVAGLISVIAPISQAGFNPARDFGPRIVAWLFGYKRSAFSEWWLYVVAPLVGAPVGAFVADKVLYSNEAEPDIAALTATPAEVSPDENAVAKASDFGSIGLTETHEEKEEK